MLEKFEKEFERLKKELKFKTTLEELDNMFFLKDYVQKEGYVSNHLSKQVCRRITEVFVSWAQYLHGLMMPNPASFVNMVESQLFNEKEKEEINRTFDKLMAIASENSIISLEDDKEREKEFIGKSVALWKELNPHLQRIFRKVNTKWTERAKLESQNKKDDLRRMYG